MIGHVEYAVDLSTVNMNNKFWERNESVTVAKREQEEANTEGHM